MSLNFQAVIEYVKYTLALTAACFAYSVEKLIPQPTLAGRVVVLLLLVVFAAAASFGVYIFGVSTKALHGDKDVIAHAEKQIEFAGGAHVVLLIAGLLFLSTMLVYRVFTEEPKHPQVCCESAASTSAR